MNINEILSHHGEDRKKYFNSIAPPIIQASNFVFDNLDDFRSAFVDELENHIYSRGNNPTVKILRKKIAALEGTEDALVLGSGASAIAAAVIGNVKAGDHIVCVEAPYGWTHKLLTLFLERFGVSHTFVDGRSMSEIENAIQANTKVLYLESPNSITFDCQDLRACSQLAKSKGITTIIDNSYASPIYQKPAQFGIDIMVHSASKYLSGHSDVVAGVICANKEMIQKIFKSEYMTLGTILSPNDAALVIRGLRTLPLRLERSFQTATEIVARLEKHPAVERVLFPFSKSFPQYDLATSQMSGAGGLFSVILKAKDIQEMENFVHRLQRFLLAVSWGGYESLVMPFCAFYNVPGRENSTVPWNLVRFYIGLEEVDYLWEDISDALAEIGGS